MNAVLECLLWLVLLPRAAAAEDSADAFVSVSATLGARWPSTDKELVSLMAGTGMTREGNYLQWRTSDSTGSVSVMAVPDGHFAIITFEPRKKQELAAGLFDVLASTSVGKAFNGPDELSLKFQGTLEKASWSDEVLLRLPRGVWEKTVRTLTVRKGEP